MNTDLPGLSRYAGIIKKDPNARSGVAQTGFQVDKRLGRLDGDAVRHFLNLTRQKGQRERLGQKVDI